MRAVIPGRLRLALVATVLLAAPALAALLAVGDDVPDLALTMSDGKVRKLSAHEGRAVLLFFYGPWAKSAPADAKTVAGFLKGREAQAFDLIGVARDAKPEDAAKFEKEAKPGFPQAADPKAEIYGRFAEKGLPWVAVVDGRRKLRYSAGGVAEDAIETALTEILGKRAGEDAGGAGGK